MKKKHKPLYPVVAILAEDWCGTSAQYSIDEAKKLNTMWAWIVGQVIYEDKDKITIALEHFVPPDDQVRNTSTIPKKNIKYRINYR